MTQTVCGINQSLYIYNWANLKNAQKILWFIQDKTLNQRSVPLILVYIAYFGYIILSDNYKRQKYVLAIILNLLFYKLLYNQIVWFKRQKVFRT